VNKQNKQVYEAFSQTDCVHGGMVEEFVDPLHLSLLHGELWRA